MSSSSTDNLFENLINILITAGNIVIGTVNVTVILIDMANDFRNGTEVSDENWIKIKEAIGRSSINDLKLDSAKVYNIIMRSIQSILSRNPETLQVRLQINSPQARHLHKLLQIYDIMFKRIKEERDNSIIGNIVSRIAPTFISNMYKLATSSNNVKPEIFERLQNYRT